MGKKQRRQKEETVAKRPDIIRARRWKVLLLIFGGVLSAAIIASVVVVANHLKPSITAAPIPVVASSAKSLDSLDALLALPPDQLSGFDIALVNLLCAKGLPGAEKLDIPYALATLDQWAKRIASETNRHLYRVTDPRFAAHYHRSEAHFRAEMLVQVLQQDLGVKYDMSAADNFSFEDSRVAFLHGMIPMPGQTLADMPGGTCASMPVMYVAIGRRLGYPLKLVTTQSHVFVRWDGANHPNPAWRARFNMEGTGAGFSSYEDDHYRNWPAKLTDKDVRSNGYLLSLTPTQELAMFLAARGHCGQDNGELAFASRCYENAYRYDTTRPCYRAWFLETARFTDYQPSTPALAHLLTRQTKSQTAARFAFDAGDPMPSATAKSGATAMWTAPDTNPLQPQITTPRPPQAPQPGDIWPRRQPLPLSSEEIKP